MTFEPRNPVFGVFRPAAFPTALVLLGVGGCSILGKGPPSVPPVPPVAAVDSVALGTQGAAPPSPGASTDTVALGPRRGVFDSSGGVADTLARAPGSGLFDSTWVAPDTVALASRSGVFDSTWVPPDTVALGRRKAISDSAAVARRNGHGVDYLWVLRSALTQRSSIDSVVARARQIGVRGLLVQVVGRGDAYYRSDLLPRSESLWNSEPEYDPLGEIMARAQLAGLEVHAWVNCMLVWSARHRPRDPRHVLNAHPEWVAQLRDGRRMSELRASDFKRLGVEGVYLSPAHPGVRTWLASVVREIAARYPVDGVHLDYIRQPGTPVGYDPTTRARFALESGVDPQRLNRLEPRRRASVDSAWKAFQREQVTAIVREVRASLEAVRPGISLSAAVIADTITAERANAQHWRSWVKQGLVDRAFLMCYAPSVQKVMDQLLALAREFGATERLVPGIAVFNTPLASAAIKLKGARALGFPLLALYSYDSLFARSPGWSLLRHLLKPSPERP